jgi:DNA adenine methylase
MRKNHGLALADDVDGAPERIDAHPFLKWAGGKWAIAPHLERLLPHDHRSRPYREPFVGGGAMFFHLQPRRAVLSDALADLVATYRVVQSQVGALIARLEKLRAGHSTEQFYQVRTLFNERKGAPRVERAAWLVYLNKTCFNGLFRTNSEGSFNVPEGRYVNPRIVDPTGLRMASVALADAELVHAPFDQLLDDAEPGDVIYFDPPYVPISKTSNFAGYSDGAFGYADQARLADVFRELDARGCLLALSNSDTPAVRELYAGYDFSPVIAPRAISSKASTRGDVTELLIRNVARYPARPLRVR